jgi:hypothetical protein
MQAYAWGHTNWTELKFILFMSFTIRKSPKKVDTAEEFSSAILLYWKAISKENFYGLILESGGRKNH